MPFKSKLKRLLSVGAGEVFSLFTDDRASRVLMYHSVDGETIFDTTGVFNITESNFNAHIQRLRKNRKFRFGALDAIGDPENAQGVLYLTFDDGYLDNFRVALPILERYGIPATVFVTCGFIERGDPRFLSAGDLRSFADHPLITIGSHGVQHLRLADCDDQSLKTEVADSKSFLEDMTSRPVHFLSYPNGSFSNRVKQAIKDNGYRCAFTSRMGSVGQGADDFELSRISVLGIDTCRTLQQKICGAWDWHGRLFLRNEDDV